MNQILRQYYKKALSRQKVCNNTSVYLIYQQMVQAENRLLALLDDEGRRIWSMFIDAAESIEDYRQMEMYKTGFLDGMHLSARQK